MTIDIADADEGDVDAIVTMAAALSAHEGMGPPKLDAATLREAMFGPDRLVHGLIARHVGALVGYALWSRGFDTQEGTATLHIIDLYVVPERRRGGVARALVDRLARRARAGGMAVITVQAMAGNIEANGFYRGLGATLDSCNSYCFARRALDDLSS